MNGRKNISQSKILLVGSEGMKVEDFIYELTRVHNNLSVEVKSSATITMIPETSTEYAKLVMTYSRPETDDEMNARISLEIKNLERIQRQRKENQLLELKKKFLEGEITSTEYERKSSILMK